jgi:hypothetical protein
VDLGCSESLGMGGVAGSATAGEAEAAADTDADADTTRLGRMRSEGDPLGRGRRREGVKTGACTAGGADTGSSGTLDG